MDEERLLRGQPTADASFRGGHHDLYEVLLAGPGPEAAGVFRSARDAVGRYRIYPERAVAGTVRTGSGRVEPGAVIVQVARLGPLRLPAAVRVVAVTDRPGEFAFSYVTLEGHPERGVVEFRLESGPSGVRFAIESWSQPGRWWSRLGAPFARAYQRRASRGALERVRREALAGAGVR